MRNFKNNIVKKLMSLSLAAAGLGFGASATYADDVAIPQPVTNVAPAHQPWSMTDLQQMTGPIALYPDALLAQVLTAATHPNEVIAAAQYLQNGGDPAQAGGFSWDASVQGLLQTPDVLKQLAGNVQWMNQLADAFINQQQDVMQSVQLLRQQAQTAGNLATTPQQQVVSNDNCIQIIPTDPQVLYVPVYDPAIVYVRRVNFGLPCITFYPGIRVGLWLHDDIDWFDHRVYFGNWGAERPWWHHDVRVGFDYSHSRPGIEHGTPIRFASRGVTTINRTRTVTTTIHNNVTRPQTPARSYSRETVSHNVANHANVAVTRSREVSHTTVNHQQFAQRSRVSHTTSARSGHR